MIDPFTFATAGQIRFGTGTAPEAIPATLEHSGDIFLVHGKNPSRIPFPWDDLRAKAHSLTTVSITDEPDLTTITRHSLTARESKAGVFLAIGGGSVLDAAKALAALATNREEPRHYLEVVGEGQPLTNDPLPVIALPTTAGTGSEVTRNAVLTVPEEKVKVSLRHPRMLPALAIVDPALTVPMPPELTAQTGMDAITQLLEALFTPFSTPLTDPLCRCGLYHAGRSLTKAFHDGNNLSAREGMAIASLLSGIALANAKLGIIHGIAAPLGGAIGAPHGAICAALAGPATAINLHALRQRQPDSPALRKMADAATLLGFGAHEADALAPGLNALAHAIDIPPLRKWGLTNEMLPSLTEQAARASSTKGNPIALLPGEILTILRHAQ